MFMCSDEECMQLEQRGLGDSEGVIESPELLTTVMGAREAIEDTEDAQVLQKYNEIFDLQSKSCVQARLCPDVSFVTGSFKQDVAFGWNPVGPATASG